MPSSFMGIETALRALFTQQDALQTTGQNISNANTKGYSRQRVNMSAAEAIDVPGISHSVMPGQLGTGVKVDSIARIREGFLDDQYRSQHSISGQWSEVNDTMTKIQGIFPEPSDTGLSSTMQKFWDSWQTLSRNPGDASARAVVKENAATMVNAFNQSSQQLTNLSDDINSNINTEATQINTYAGQIADLNLQISRISAMGDNPNDLMDKRDLTVDKLSKLVNIKKTESNGRYNISIGKIKLVTGNKAGTPVTASSLQSAYASGDLTGGTVHGMLDSVNKLIPQYQSQLDSLVKTMAEGKAQVTLPAGTVIPKTLPAGVTGVTAGQTLTSDTTVTVPGINGLAQLGYSLSSPAKAAPPFFSIKAGASDFTAASIEVNPSITADDSLIPASMQTYTDAAGKQQVKNGNGDAANLISQMQHQTFTFGSSGSSSVIAKGSLDDFYQAIVAKMGVDGQQANQQNTNQKVILDQIDSQRQSVSGVSIDEEMANMIKYQHTYTAAARLMTTFDQLLNTVINNMGMVGR